MNNQQINIKMKNDNHISKTEIFKIITFVDSDHDGKLYPDDAMSDGEVLDHVMDKLRALVRPEPYIDQWTKEAMEREHL